MANGDIIWAIKKLDTSGHPSGIIKLTRLGEKWFRQDSMQMSHALDRVQVDAQYFVFEDLEEANLKARDIREHGSSKANDNILWAIIKLDTLGQPIEIIKLTRLGKKWFRQDSMQMSHALDRVQVDAQYFAFEGYKEASDQARDMNIKALYAKEQQRKLVKQKEGLEKKEIDLQKQMIKQQQLSAEKEQRMVLKKALQKEKSKQKEIDDEAMARAIEQRKIEKKKTAIFEQKAIVKVKEIIDELQSSWQDYDNQKQMDEEQKRKKHEDEASKEIMRDTLDLVKMSARLDIAKGHQEAVFKTFIKEIVFTDTKLVNKALFAVTLNNRFNGSRYKVEGDIKEFLQHVTANQMKEVLDLLSLR